LRRVSGPIGACIAVLAAGALPLAADIELGRHQQLMTRFGLAEVRENPVGQPALFVNGQERALNADGFIRILGAWGRQGDEHDWLLVGVDIGAIHTCSQQMILLKVTSYNSSSSQPFPSCAGQVFDIDLAEAAITLGLPHPDFIVERENVSWDGDVGPQEHELVWQMIPPFPPADVDPTEWIGRSSRVIVENPVARGHVAHELGAFVARSLSDGIGQGVEVAQRGDWVLGAGCQTGNCNGMAAAWGIRLRDLGVGVAIFRADRFDGLYGLADDPDDVFAQWMDEHRR
jgi:hypothetical protein